LRQAIDNVRKDGTIVKLGATSMPLNFSLSDLTYRSQTLKGHHAYDVTSWRNCLGLLEKSMLTLDPLITHTLPLEAWEQGMELMRTRKGIKVILDPTL
jgi:threonine dehydrogenase-like Zn-dependent dehydrogenase